MDERIESMILELCKNQEWTWENHIRSVVKFSKILAKKLNADEEIAEVASWLHDIKKLKGKKEMHHVHGAEEAGNILKELGYEQQKIEKIKYCILTHSSDENYPPETAEAKIVACADALSHLDLSLDIFYTAFSLKNFDIEKAREWLKKKYNAGWKKITLLPEAQKMAEKKYRAVMKTIEKGL